MKAVQEQDTQANREQLGKELNLFAMSKEGLIKKIQILMHELSICYRYEEGKGKLDEMGIDSIHKELV
jgi:hypothetical protein